MFHVREIYKQLKNQGGTVSEFVQASPMVKIYQELADKVLEMSEDTKGDE